MPLGKNEILRVDGVHDVLGRKVLRLQRLQIEIDRNQPLLAAVRPGDGGALHRDEADADLVHAGVKDFLLGQPLAADAILQDRNGRGVVLNDQRRGRPGRHRAQDGLRDGGDLRHARVHGCPLAEEHLDDADAVVGGGLDVLDVVDRGRQRALMVVHHALFDFLRAQAGVTPEDADHRDVNRREKCPSACAAE